MEPTYSPAWFATFGRPDAGVTAREVEFLARVLPAPPATVLDVPCGFGRGLTLNGVFADFSEQPPTSETPRMQLVFRRDT